MQKNYLDFYVCPDTGKQLSITQENKVEGSEVIEGILSSEDGASYKITDGIPNFTIYLEEGKNEYAVNLFKDKAKIYDQYQHLSFEIFFEKEDEVRKSMIDKLNLAPNASVLEVNCGTGRDSVLLAGRLSTEGKLQVQDISRDMLEICQSKLKEQEVPFEIHQGNAVKLPYKDNSFDAVYSFGGVGMNTYSNNKDAIAELVRVTKEGGKVVFGGLSLAPWLRDTHFGKVLINHNSHYANEIMFTDLPVECRNLNLNWILNGAGFVIDFTVGTGEPKADFDFQIPGVRGGSLSTRYFGNLEGVTPEAKKLAYEAREKLGISMHEWIDELIKKEANKILNS